MDQESFERSIKSKFENNQVATPKSVWSGVNNSLNEEAIIGFKSSQNKFRWIAGAATFLAFFSFVLNFGYQNNDELSVSDNFNALLPSSPDHFRFPEPEVGIADRDDNKTTWSRILFIQPDKPNAKKNFNEAMVQKKDTNTSFEIPKINRLTPFVDRVPVSTEIDPYYVAQHRYENKDKNKNEFSGTSFWAGVEAGAGNFNPDFSGSDPISTTIDFATIADNLGQNEFINPRSSASQNDMGDGIVTSVGIDFGLKMGRRWTLESGVQYASVDNRSSASLSIVDARTIRSNDIPAVPSLAGETTRKTELEARFEHTVNLENNLRFTSIPLKAGYFLMDRKVSLRLNAGIAANYFLGSSLSDPTGQLLGSSQVNTYNDWSFDGLTGFELGYSIVNNVNLTMEPTYRQSITPLSSSLNTGSGFMIQTGVRYTIK